MGIREKKAEKSLEEVFKSSKEVFDLAIDAELEAVKFKDLEKELEAYNKAFSFYIDFLERRLSEIGYAAIANEELSKFQEDLDHKFDLLVDTFVRHRLLGNLSDSEVVGIVELVGSRGLTLGKLERHKEAMRCFDSGIKILGNFEPLEPERWLRHPSIIISNLYYDKAIALFKIGKEKEAISAFAEARRLSTPFVHPSKMSNYPWLYEPFTIEGILKKLEEGKYV